MKKGILLSFFVSINLFIQINAQPNIRTNGGLGQYGYFERDAIANTHTPFWVANGGYGNIYQYGVRSYINGNENNYVYSATGSCARGDDVTGNFIPSLNTGSTVYSSVFVEYCGPSYSCGNMTPTVPCFNERSFFVMDLVPKTDAILSSIDKSSDNNVVLTFTLSNNNTSGQTLNRLWISNDGTATESTDIQNGAFYVYYEPATGSETFNGNESSIQLFGDYNSNSTSNNVYGHDALGISIPQNDTGGLRCYVVLKGSLLNESAISKTVRMSIIVDGISITPNRDTNYSLMKLDATQPSSSYLTIIKEFYYYKSKTDGSWSSTSTWQQSVDNSTWVAATSVPASTAKGITISTGNLVSVSSAVTTPSSDKFTVNGTLEFQNGGSVSTAPTYGTGSTLKYNGTSSRGTEWTVNAQSGAGYPYHVEITSGTLTLEAATKNDHFFMGGDLNIISGAKLIAKLLDATASPGPWNQKGLVIAGDIINAGTLEMATDCHQAISCDDFTNTGSTTLSPTAVGGDLYITGNFNNNGAAASSVNINGRALIMTGSKDQVIGGSAAGTYAIDYFIVAKSGGKVALMHDMLSDGEANGQAGGGAVTVNGAILDISGRIVQVSANTSNFYSTITCDASGSIRTNASTKLYVLGDESTKNVGTLRFDQTTPGTTNVIGVLRFNRSNAQASINIVNNFIVADSLKIEMGKLNSSADIQLKQTAVATLSSTNSTAALQLRDLILSKTSTNAAEFYKNGRSLTISGKVSTKVSFEKTAQWHFIAFPYAVTGVRKSDGTTAAVLGTDYSLGWYDPAARATNISGWKSTTESMVAGKGYLINKKSVLEDLYFDSSVQGGDNMFNTTATVGVTYTTGLPANLPCNYGWNFVAHPLSAKGTPSLTDGEFAYNYNPANDSYKLYYYMYNPGYTYTAGGLKPFDAYFIKSAAAGNVSYGLTNPQGVRRQNAPAATTEELVVMNLNANSNQYETLVRLLPEATAAHDELYDAPYSLPQSNSTPQLYTLIAADKYALNTVPVPETQNSTVLLGVKLPAAGDYTFNWDNSQNTYPATLTDILTGKVTNLADVSTYGFNSTVSGTIEDRFVLNFMKKAATGIQTITGNLKVFVRNRNIVIEGLAKPTTVSIFDVAGRLWRTQQVSSSVVSIPVLFEGVYLLRLTDKDGNFNTRIMCR